MFPVLLVFILLSQTAGAASVGASYLTIPTGARAVGMGQAFSALSNDASGLWWNPAALSQMSMREAHFSHAELFADTRLEYISFGLPKVSSMGSFGFQGLLLTQGAIEQRGETGEKQGTFSATDLAVGVTYARPVLFAASSIGPGLRIPRLHFGITAKFLRQTLAGAEALGFAADLGLLYRPLAGTGKPLERFSLSVGARNIGPSMKFVSEPFLLPAALFLGASYNFLGVSSVAMDINYRPADNKTHFAIGAEFTPVPLLALRAGYLAKLISATAATSGSGISSSDLTGFSGGMGLKISRYSLDYAILPKADLGSSHRVSFSLKF